MSNNKRKPFHCKSEAQKKAIRWNYFKRSKKKKIFTTTDGFLSNNKRNKKKRRVVVVEQRKSDGALAVSKIHSKEGKDEKNCVDNLILSPNKHNSLIEDSIVETRVIFGIKEDDAYKPIYQGDMVETNDSLSFTEFQKLKKEAGGKTKKNKKTYKNTLKRWKKRFKK